MLTKQKTLLERAPWQRAAGKGNPGGLLCQVACNLGFYGDEKLPGGGHIIQPRWIPAQRILGDW